MLRTVMMLMALFVSGLAISAENSVKSVLGADSIAGKYSPDAPIELNLDVKGVKLQSIYFSGKQAMVILWNRRPKGVGVSVDVTLYDAQGKLIAVGKRPVSLIGGSIRAGKQENFNFDFSHYVADMGQVATYAVVFSVIAGSDSKSSVSPGDTP